jgi:signal transduction histidine kinase
MDGATQELERLREENRRLTALVAAIPADKAENARLQEQLQKSEERFRLALAHSHVTVFELDLELRFRWLHNPPAGVQPPLLADAGAGDPNAQFPSLVRRVLATGQGFTEENVEYVAGEPRNFLISIEPLRDAGGAIVGAIGAGTDITATKRAEVELAQALAFREQMMGVLGHDLRNPLTAIRGLTGLLLLGDLPAPARSHIDRIDRAAQRMFEMISTLLDFTESRFRGGISVVPAPADLRDIVGAVVDELRAAHPDRAIELDVSGASSGNWDGARLAQVVSNLVANALTHGGPGDTVRVTLAGDADVVLTVANGGAPIAPELLATLFEPFRRGDDGGRTRGLGLGLYIVEQIVRAHGGTIAVESNRERGTRFTVRLPRG